MQPDLPGFQGRVGLQQRVIPDYRAAFLERLGSRCSRGLDVFAGLPGNDEGIVAVEHLEGARLTLGRNRRFLRGSVQLHSQPGLQAWLESIDADALILEANPRYLSNRGAMRWMHARNRTVVGWGLGVTSARGWAGSLRRWLRRRYLLGFDGVIAYSSRGAQQYNALGLPPERVFVAPNASLQAPPTLPTRPPLADRRPRLLFVGRLQPRKRVDLLLRAVRQLPIQTDLWIVGDGPARAALEQEAVRLGVPARFIGDVRGEALNGLLDQADLFVLPGTGGLAVQQAMAHGLPVIVAEGDGTQSDMVTPANGWLVPSQQEDGLRNALGQALVNPGRLAGMGAESHRLAVERFNVDAMADAFVRALNAVAAARS